MAKKTPKTQLATLSPKSATVALFAETDLSHHVQAAIADHQQSEGKARESAFFAFRCGLRFVLLRETKPGELTKAIKACDKGNGPKRRTIFNYMTMARRWLDENGLIVKRKLADKEAVLPLLEDTKEGEQPAWLLPDADKREDLLGKALRWIGDRSINDIYEDMAREGDQDAAFGTAKFGGKHGNDDATKEEEPDPAEVRAALEEEAAAGLNWIQDFVTRDVFHKDADGNRPTLEEAAKIKNPGLTLSLLNKESREEARLLFLEAAETLKYVEALHEGHEPVKRAAKKTAKSKS